MKIERLWAMPSANTFECQPIGDFVRKYLELCNTSVDPFARNVGWADYTNDLNPDTSAQYHTKALDFLIMLRDWKELAGKIDLIIFDPPYSLRQIKECYDKVGEFTFEDSKYAGKWTEEKSVCYDLLKVDGYFLHFGWHTNGLGLKNKALIEEILLVAHGGAHNDTICMAERKIAHQQTMGL